MPIEQPTLSEDDDPIERFLDDRAGKAEGTWKDYERTLTSFRCFLHQEYGEDVGLDEANTPAVVNSTIYFRKNGLTDESNSLSDASLRNVLSHLNAFYKWGGQYGFPNPIPEAKEQLNLNPKNTPTKIPQVDPDEWRAYLKVIKNIKAKCILTLYLKTGIRVGELCNLDVEDVNINYAPFKKSNSYGHLNFYKNSSDPPNRWPDTIYIRSDIKQGDTVDGEYRPHGTKRERGTPFPIDKELKIVLLNWLKIRPDTPKYSTNPLFSNAKGSKKRIRKNSVRSILDNVYNRRSIDQEFTNHDFRRYWVTYLRDEIEWGAGISDPTLRYLRGDSLHKDMLDLYTQDWAYKVDKPYKDNIYNLL